MATPEGAEDALGRSMRGDPAAFGDLVREHQAMVFSLALHFLRNRALAEEVAQEVFLDLYQNLGSIRSATHLKFWLRKVACHRSIDYGRRQRPHLSLEDVPEPSGPIGRDSPSDLLLARTLQGLVASLPRKARMVVVLRFQEELEYHEIAEVMEIPINSVKSCLQRSLAILREKLNRCAGDVRYEATGR
ncbi:MAG: RNA polymerase sigma factor [Terriglobia bacterium]